MPPKPKKGISLEEKRTKLLEFFTREHSFYNIKEIETQGSKFTGVHAMQIKDLLQSLVDDGLVNAEKCGITVVYWCFEYDKIRTLQNLVEKKSEKLDVVKKSLQTTQKELQHEKSLRADVSKTEQRMELWKSLEKKRDLLKTQLESTVFDEDRVEEIKIGLRKTIASGEIYTDNIEALVYHFQKNNRINRDHFKQELGIPEEFTDFPNLDVVFEDMD